MKGFDVICLCETRLSNNLNGKLIEIPGYTLFRQDRCSNPAVGKRGGGLCVYIQDNLVKFSEVNIGSCLSDLV